MRVTLRRKVRGSDNEDVEVAWPRGWPLPEAGSIVIGPEGFGDGFCQHVEFDLPNGRIIVVLR